MITSIVVVVLSAAFAAVGAIARFNRRKTQILSSAYFQLLQLWRELRIMTEVTLTDYVRIYLDEVKKHVPKSAIESPDGQTLEGVILPLLRTFVPSSLVGGYSVEQFDATLLKVAAFHPILAYRLAANARLRSAIVAAEAYGKQVASLAESELTAPGTKALNAALDDMLGWIVKDSLPLLERDVVSLSWKVGLGTFLSAVYRLKVRRRNTAALLKADVERFVQHLFRAGSPITLIWHNHRRQPKDQEAAGV